MAILRHPLALTAIACVMVAAALIPPQGLKWSSYQPDEIRRVERALRLAQRELEVTRIRDSLRLVFGNRPVTPGMTFVAEAYLQGPDIERMMARVEREWGTLIAATGRSVVVLLDSVFGRWFLDSKQIGPDRCVLHAHLNPRWRDRFGGRTLLELGPGPCAFLARFGTPSPSVDTWLARHSHAFIQEDMWLQPTGSSVRRRHRLREINADWRRYDRASPVLRACASGRIPACRAALELVQEPGWSGSYYRSESFDSYLSELIEIHGEPAFAKFWTSTRPVEAAFREAYGKSLDEWSVEWAQRQVGQIQAPGPPWASYGITLLIGVAFLAGGSVVVARRQVR